MKTRGVGWRRIAPGKGEPGSAKNRGLVTQEDGVAIMKGGRPKYENREERRAKNNHRRKLSLEAQKIYPRICHLCHKEIIEGLPKQHPQSWSMDHVIPVSKGGKDVIENVRPSHLSCNSRRQASSIESFANHKTINRIGKNK